MHRFLSGIFSDMPSTKTLFTLGGAFYGMLNMLMMAQCWFWQIIVWPIMQFSRFFFKFEVHYSPEDLKREKGQNILIASGHETPLDPFFELIALPFWVYYRNILYRHLASISFRDKKRRARKLLIRVVYFMFQSVVLVSREKDTGLSLQEKLGELKEVLEQGYVGWIAPAGHVRRPDEPADRPCRSGVAWLYYETGARILPVAVWLKGKVPWFRYPWLVIKRERLDPLRTRTLFRVEMRTWYRTHYAVNFGSPMALPEELREKPDEAAELIRTELEMLRQEIC